MTIASVLAELERYAPSGLAQDWDNVGLIIGEPEREVHRVLISLDATPNTLNYAIEHGFDLILSHHPLILHPLKCINNPVILRMIEAKVSLISMHTNFDAARGGVNHALADKLGLEIKDELGDAEAGDIGLVCHREVPGNLQEIARDVKERLGAPNVRLWMAEADEQRQISQIAICGGAGASVLQIAEDMADLLITGDISYHVFLDSKIPIIDAGHFYTEYPALVNLQKSLQPTGLKSEILPRNLHEWSQKIRYIR